MIYPHSKWTHEGSDVVMIRREKDKALLASGSGRLYDALEGERSAEGKICPLNAHNAEVVRKTFPEAAPVSHRSHKRTFGLGDRLDCAGPGFIRLFDGKGAFPVLAQQSMRELNLTGRTYGDVLDGATWAVIQEGWKKGYGADGDHLKTPEEIKMALSFGYTMITLDCSDHIDKKIAELSDSEIELAYADLPDEDKARWETLYMDKDFNVSGMNMHITGKELKRDVMVYYKAIDFIEYISNEIIGKTGDIDLEVSVDETATSTSITAHFIIASELKRRHIPFVSLAPRFCGHFEKGIDYVGDVVEFEKEYKQHEAIANAMGYKLSIHSGSDKFKVFPIIGKYSDKFHIKTSGTNWLEAVRLIAMKAPALYRAMHKIAIDSNADAKRFYVISGTIDNIPPLDELRDIDLPLLLDKVDSRQALHIAYGYILQAEDTNGKYYMKEAVLGALFDFEEDYWKNIQIHIGKHLNLLGVK